jgi:Na+/proline symporter
MLTAPVILIASFAYLGLLFAIAYYGDKRADAGRSIIANPYIFALSLAVYCTSWTFYGSVGRAATSGIGFLPIYLGPTLMAALWWYVMLKIIRISKQNRITSIADFLASRYGKSQMLGGLVTIIAVVGIIPYIALQLKAISNTFSIILHVPEVAMLDKESAPLFLGDNTFYIAMLLAAFTILFGTRHLDASTTRAWWRRSRSSRWSSSSPSSRWGCSSRFGSTTASAISSAAPRRCRSSVPCSPSGARPATTRLGPRSPSSRWLPSCSCRASGR